jgi:dolichol-phosphate mannosyltransferase
MRATVCLPTYNELENLEPMINALRNVLREGDRVLIIDDASPDGTGQLADTLTHQHPFLNVLHRPQKQGLGPAYIAGFHQAIRDGAELILEMDCDFSHDPNTIPTLIHTAEQGADLVLGSRYTPGGQIPNWGLTRRLISQSGNTYARLILQSKLKDLTGGFKCFHTHVLNTINLNTITARGYAFQIETTYRTLHHGYHVTEIPITFTDRQHGHSKMSPTIITEAIWKVPTLRLRALTGRL